MTDLTTRMTPQQMALFEKVMDDARVLKAVALRLSTSHKRAKKAVKYFPMEGMLIDFLKAEGDALLDGGKKVETSRLLAAFTAFAKRRDPTFEIVETAFGKWLKRLRPQLIKTRKYANFTRSTYYSYRWTSAYDIEKNVGVGRIEKMPTDRQLIAISKAYKTADNTFDVEAHEKALAKRIEKNEKHRLKMQEVRAERNEKRKIQQREAAAKARQAPSPNDIFGDLL